MDLKGNAGPIAIVIGAVAVIGLIVFFVIKFTKNENVNSSGPVFQPPGYAQGNAPAGQAPVGNMSRPGAPGGAGGYSPGGMQGGGYAPGGMQGGYRPGGR